MNIREMFFEELERNCKSGYAVYLQPYEESEKWLAKDKAGEINKNDKWYFKDKMDHQNYKHKTPITYEEFVKRRLRYITSEHNYQPVQRRVGGG